MACRAKQGKLVLKDNRVLRAFGDQTDKRDSLDKKDRLDRSELLELRDLRVRKERKVKPDGLAKPEIEDSPVKMVLEEQLETEELLEQPVTLE